MFFNAEFHSYLLRSNYVYYHNEMAGLQPFYWLTHNPFIVFAYVKILIQLKLVIRLFWNEKKKSISNKRCEYLISTELCMVPSFTSFTR